MITPTTFEHDLIDHKDFADSLERFIQVEQQFVEGSLVVALSAEFDYYYKYSTRLTLMVI